MTRRGSSPRLGYDRMDRVADQVREEVADILLRRLADPRVAGVTVTHVTVSRDLKHARVLVSVLGGPESRQAAGALLALGHAAGFIRAELGRRLTLRCVPELRFEIDASVARGDRLMDMIRSVAGGKPAPPDSQDSSS